MTDIFSVEIIQANSFSTTVTTDEDWRDYIVMAKEGETLRIYLDPHHPFTDFSGGTKNLKAKITMPALYGLHLSGATRGSVSGFKSSHDCRLDVSGTSSLEINNNIEMGNLEAGISGASQITGSLKASDAKFEVAGASTLRLKGSATSLTLNASGASKVDLTDFTIDNAKVNLSGASEATLHIKGKLDCVVSAASSLYFLGNPTMGNVQVTGASTIKHK